MNKYQINRKMYHNIRRMDHSQMSSFLEGVYKNGYADGQKAAEGLTASEIREVLLAVKGLGEKRVNTIVNALETAMSSKAVNN